MEIETSQNTQTHNRLPSIGIPVTHPAGGPGAYRTTNADQEMNDPSPYEETKTNPNGFFHDTKSAAACSVRVAVRVRPLVSRELYESPNICIKCYEQENQLVIGKDRNFAFDKVFDSNTRQQDVFETCVKNLVLGTFLGYNATVLAYGQTGSGKTHTMGSGYTIGVKEQELGIIPRVIKLIFEEVDKRRSKADIVIKCAFLEIYNEELHDLLDHNATSASTSNGIIDRFIQKKEIQIREEKNGSISLFGLREDKVSSYEELAACLDKGSNFRSTASTLMNNCSSRSHAIFTITIEQSIIEDLYKADAPNQQAQSSGDQAEEYMVAKFHFVDLAGSERAKRTGATGNTLKEGISINKGLLALGNVIAALTEDAGKKGHVPYRDSKLTRILQDSLGGNSRTSMIACVSPAEINFEETLNSLKYASRARNIKNAPKVNRDPNSAQIAQLRQQVFDLQRELSGCKKILVSNNIEYDLSQMPSIQDFPQRDSMMAGIGGGNQDFYSNQHIQKLEQELKDIKMEKQSKEKKVAQLQAQLDQASDQNAQTQIEFFTAKKERDQLRMNLEGLVGVLKRRNIYEEIMQELSASEFMAGDVGGGGLTILEEYQNQLESQRVEIQDKSQLVKTLQRDYEYLMTSSNNDIKRLEQKEQEIERLKRSVTKLQKEVADSKASQRQGNLSTVKSAVSRSNEAAAENKKRYTFGAHNAKSSNPNNKRESSKLPLAQQTELAVAQELDIDISRFNDMFIENLSQQLSGMFGKKPDPTNLEDPQQPVESNENEDSEDSDSDDHAMQDVDEEIQIPNSDKDQQEVINSHEEVKQEDQMIRSNLQKREQMISHMEDELKSKEDLLDKIKTSHKTLTQNLLEAMKQEYHKKISAIQQEMFTLEQERAEQLRRAGDTQQRTKLEEFYKKKLKDLEDKERLAKQKDQEQQSMSRQSANQKERIKQLESEITRSKEQRVNMMKQMREEAEKHRKWKADRCKEIMQIKQSNVKKDREIQMLKRENKKKELIAKRKQEELTAMQKKTKTDKQKQINAQKDKSKKKGIDAHYLQNWIVNNTDKLLKYKEHQVKLNVKKNELNEVDLQIIQETNLYSKAKIRRDKLEERKAHLEMEEQASPNLNFDEEYYQIDEELGQLTLDMRVIQDSLDNLEEKNDFIQNQLTQIKTAIIDFNPSDIEELKFDEVQSLEGARACLSAFFTILLDTNVYKQELEAQNQQQIAIVEGLNMQLEELKNMLQANELSFQTNLEQLNKEYADKEELLIKIIMENGEIDMDNLMLALQNKQLPPALGGAKQNQEDPRKKGSAGIAQRIQSAKLEIQKNNQKQYAESKTFLSKRIAELEREKNDESKKYEAIKHKLEQTNTEKEQFKRLYETLKLQNKQQEINGIKQFKTNAQASQEESGGSSAYPNTNGLYSTNQQRTGSPRASGQQLMVQGIQQQAQQPQKMNTLRDMRNERKIKKMSGVGTQKNQEPRVIADEPMDDDDEDQNSPEKPTIQINEPPQFMSVAPTSNKANGEVVINNVFARLNQPGKGRSALGSFAESVQSSMINQVSQNMVSSYIDQQQNEDDQNWVCERIKNSAHQGPILAMAQCGNHLYSSSNKSLKIWDFETMQTVSDIQAHNGFIRCLGVSADQKIVTASDKTINLWDRYSLTQVSTLRGHKEEIRAIAFPANNPLQLYSGGKGSQNGSSLLLWDLRNSSQPVFDEFVKGIDIFCLQTTQDYLFIGCRNHTVIPFNLKTNELQMPFDPPHFDAVTSLAVLNDGSLISGSRDKNLRCWDQRALTSIQPCQAIMGAHNDWINILETDNDHRFLYSGCKDGTVKVWRMKNGRQLKCTAQLFYQNSATVSAGTPAGSTLVASGAASGSSSLAINAICKIDKQFGQTMFATGGNDKTIKIWRYKEPQYQGYKIPKEVEGEDEDDIDNYLKNGSGQPDFEMVDDVHISPTKYNNRFPSPEEDDFDCDADPVVNGGGGFGPTTHHNANAPHFQLKHQQSARIVEEQKHAIQKVRTIARTNTALTGGGQAVMSASSQAFSFGAGNAAMSKLEQKRREKQMMPKQQQLQPRRFQND